ncbi:MAG: iron permease [Pseudonocardiales bacterium]|nr:iron permease [Pseudonocardiales bacterium]
MLPTFVIGLREGLEAALIVGIIAAFLKQRGRRDLLRKVWLGVAVAAILCLGVGVGLHILSADLPQKQQEGLETVVGAIAVVMVTYMVVWMRRHSRDLKKQLEGATDSALESGSGMALVGMAFLAVFREGFETAVFLLAAFNNSANPAEAGVGALLGLVIAIGLGYGIYRGGVSLNLSKFFRFTGLVLVLVAAGLVVSALHTAHEAGWLNAGQSRTVDLTWLVQPGSVQSSLLTGMLGLQPRPVIIELIGWLVYLVPIGLYVAWPPGRSAPHRAVIRIGAPLAALMAVAAIVLTLVGPSRPNVPATSAMATTSTNNGTTTATTLTVAIDQRSADSMNVSTTTAGESRQWRLAEVGTESVGGRRALIYRLEGQPAATPTDLAATMTIAQVQAANGGRLPLGVRAATEAGAIPVTYSTTQGLTVWLDDETGLLLRTERQQRSTTTATLSIGPTKLSSGPTSTQVTTPAQITRAAAQAAKDERAIDRRSLLSGYRTAAWFIAALAGLGVVTSIFALRRRPSDPPVTKSPISTKSTEALHT